VVDRAEGPVPSRRFGWWDMFVPPEEDPRVDGGWGDDERSVLRGSLADRRMTLELKCAGLDAEQLARRPIPPSDLSLLGLIRHLAGVERHWIRRVLDGEACEPLFRGEGGRDVAFEVTADAAIVEEAWAAWRAEVAHAESVIAGFEDLGERGRGEPVPVREVLVHLIREYAQHMGHADLLRERIDGRVGQ
jgi:uncharacterized damage-inducible protein DinB